MLVEKAETALSWTSNQTILLLRGEKMDRIKTLLYSTRCSTQATHYMDQKEGLGESNQEKEVKKRLLKTKKGESLSRYPGLDQKLWLCNIKNYYFQNWQFKWHSNLGVYWPGKAWNSSWPANQSKRNQAGNYSQLSIQYGGLSLIKGLTQISWGLA